MITGGGRLTNALEATVRGNAVIDDRTDVNDWLRKQLETITTT